MGIKDRGPQSQRPMSRDSRLQLLVTAVAIAGGISVVPLWYSHLPFPGWWPLATFLFVASLLESLNTPLRIAAKGSTSFIMHMASALLFGGLWGAVVAGLSTLFGELARNNPPLKIVFNVSQRILAVSLAALSYHALGGQLPPAYLASEVNLASEAVQRDLGLFVVFASVYFLINSAAVNAAVVLSSS